MLRRRSLGDEGADNKHLWPSLVMTGQDLIDAIRAGRAHVSWGTLTSEHNGHQLKMSVFRDAMKFDGIPAMTWRRIPVPEGHPDFGKVFDGVRMPVTAVEMQQIADLLGCMMLTPKLIDLIWLEAGKSGVQFESIVNLGPPSYPIVAEADIHVVHRFIEAALAKAGGDNGGFIDSVGKYWVLCNAMLVGKFSALLQQAINYGWATKDKGNGPGVTGKVNMWQRIGAQHSFSHYDPSQVIRLVYRMAKLLRAGTTDWVDAALYDVATDPELAPLISHEGVLKVTRQQGVPEPPTVRQADGSYLLPETIILGDPQAALLV